MTQAKFMPIVRHYQGLITSGQIAPGATLPSASTIAAEWRVTRETVGSAIWELTKRGLVSSVRGHPATVLAPSSVAHGE